MRRAASLLGLGAIAFGCGGASSQSGVTAYLQLANAQFVPGALVPGPDAGVDAGATGPAIHGVNFLTTKIYPGVENLPLSGDVQEGSSVLIGLANDAGYWIVPTPFLDPQTPNNFAFQTKMSFSPLTPMGNQILILRGVDAAGNIGPAQQFTLDVTPPIPTGTLVITLEWDTESDMDLHVVVPNPNDATMPIEIWSKAPVGLPPRVPGNAPPTKDELAAEIAAAGALDFDSNAACVIDGRRQENVIYTQPPPSGTYTVRVDAFSLCGQADAQWQAVATTPDGQIVSPAIWEATDADTRGNHGVGAGRLAFEFSIP
jgi:hypothetical protein